eukprot:330287-Amphidinium_carterae.1
MRSRERGVVSLLGSAESAQAVEFCLEHGGRALLGDEMGLGKTVCSLTAVRVPSLASSFHHIDNGLVGRLRHDVEQVVDQKL